MPANCDISSGRTLPCKQGSAGLLSVYFINRPVLVSYDATDPTLVDDITTSAAGAITAYQYELDNDGANYTENLNADRNNGTFFYEQVITVALQSLQEQDKAQFDSLAKGRPLAVIHYRNGKAVLVGISRGLDTSGSNTSGGALGDFSGYNLTLTANENSYAPFLKDSTVDNPFAGLTTPPTVNNGES
jgi:hypothetical protein